jgi:hypothetical protein
LKIVKQQLRVGSFIPPNLPKEGTEQYLWKFTRFIRFRDRMYNLAGTIIESAEIDEIALKDLFGIADTFAIIQ